MVIRVPLAVGWSIVGMLLDGGHESLAVVAVVKNGTCKFTGRPFNGRLIGLV